MVCSLHSVTTGSRDRANVSLIILIILITSSWMDQTVGFTYLQSMDFQRDPQSKHHLYCEQENQPTAMDLYFLDWYAPDSKPNQRRTQNQPTRYYDQADASYELGPRGQLGWGSGLALAIWVGLGRVGQEVKKNNLRSKYDVWTVVLSESPWTANRRSPDCPMSTKIL